MSKKGRPKKEDAKRISKGFRQNDTGELMLKYVLKEKKKNTTDYLNDVILNDFLRSKGYRKGRPFYCVETREVFSSGRECCEKYGITRDELNDCLYTGISANGYTFEFII